MTDPSIDFFIGLERQVWEALRAGDPAADTALLSNDFVGVYPTGFADRTAHAARLDDGPTVVEYEISNTSLLRLTDEHVVLSYAARYRRTDDASAQTMYISSIWSKRDGSWINTFSQDTPAATTGDATPTPLEPRSPFSEHSATNSTDTDPDLSDRL